MVLPSGTITFLFTDIEGSTKLWESHPEAMRPALARHDALMCQAIEANHGVVFKTIGVAFCAAFATAADALQAALSAHLLLRNEDWVEMGSLRVAHGLAYRNWGIASLSRLMSDSPSPPSALSSPLAQAPGKATYKILCAEAKDLGSLP